MKFIHTADIHLGAAPDAGTAYSKGRPGELWDSFSRLIDLCEEEQMDLLLIAGDLFHRQPLLRELKEVNYLFSKLSHTKVVLIAGNHDYIKKDSYYRTFQWNKNVHPLFGQEMRYAAFPQWNLAVYGFSYHTREILEARYTGKAPGKYRHEILLAHGGDERHVPLKRELLVQAGFDYIALGHIHKPHALVKNLAVYSGALEPVDKNDTGAHGFVRGEITENGTSVEFVPFALREYFSIPVQSDEFMTNGRLRDELREIVEQKGIQNLYRFTILGERDADVSFNTEYMDSYGNILEVTDETVPAYDYEKLYEQNRENLIGKYIESFSNCAPGSVEELALQEGVRALLKNGV